MRASQWEVDAVVVESGRRPACGGMAGVAGLRESAGNVVGIGGSLEILEMARHAPSTVQVVIVVNVTIGAGARWDGVQPGEGEPGAVVVEFRVGPVAGVMALLASLREVRSRVVGIRCSLEIFQVAADAGRICARQVVVVIDVALRALHAGVRPGQREPGG